MSSERAPHPARITSAVGNLHRDRMGSPGIVHIVRTDHDSARRSAEEVDAQQTEREHDGEERTAVGRGVNVSGTARSARCRGLCRCARSRVQLAFARRVPNERRQR